MDGELFRQYSKISNLSADIDNLQRVHEILKELPKSFKGRGARLFRFCTFSATNGSSAREQLEKLWENGDWWPRIRQGGKIQTFPKILYEILKQNISDDLIPSNVVRQYFCMVKNDNKNGNFVRFIDIPEECFSVRKSVQLRTSTISDQFNLLGLTTYISLIDREIQNIRKSLSVIIDDLLKNKFPDIDVLMLEMITNNLSNPELNGGILVNFTPNEGTIRFCPHCTDNYIEEFSKGNYCIVFPPLPIVSIGLNTFCTENEHKEHTWDDCIQLREISDKINEIRKSQNMPIFNVISVMINDKRHVTKFGDAIWLPSHKVSKS